MACKRDDRMELRAILDRKCYGEKAKSVVDVGGGGWEEPMCHVIALTDLEI